MTKVRIRPPREEGTRPTSFRPLPHGGDPLPGIGPRRSATRAAFPFPILGLLCLFLWGIAASTGAGEAADRVVDGTPPDTLRLATGSDGGTFLPVGHDLARWIESRVDGVVVRVDTTAGSVDNLRRLTDGEADLAVVGASPLRKILDERLRITRGLSDICIVGTLYDDAEQYLVRTSLVRAGNMLDLNGLLMYPGPHRSGGEIDTRTILETLRVEPNYVYPLERDKGYSEAAEALARGEFDAATFSGGVPIEAVTELLAAHPGEYTIVPFSRHQLSKVRHRELDFERVVIPAGTYPGQEEDIVSVGGPNLLVAGPGLDDATIAAVDAAIREGIEEEGRGLRDRDSHPVLRKLTREMWRRSPMEEGRCRSILSASSEGASAPAPPAPAPAPPER